MSDKCDERRNKRSTDEAPTTCMAPAQKLKNQKPEQAAFTAKATPVNRENRERKQKQINWPSKRRPTGKPKTSSNWPRRKRSAAEALKKTLSLTAPFRNLLQTTLQRKRRRFSQSNLSIASKRGQGTATSRNINKEIEVAEGQNPDATSTVRTSARLKEAKSDKSASREQEIYQYFEDLEDEAE